MALRIKKSELNSLIKEAVLKQDKKLTLESKKSKLLNDLEALNEESVAPQTQVTPDASAAAGPKTEKQESIFDAKPGETVIFNFQDVTIKVQRQLDDLFKVTDASESKKLKDGDYIKIQGNDTLANGKKFKFVILRQALNYESNPLVSWKVIKN